MAVQAFTDLCKLHLHNGAHGRLRQWTVNHGLETGKQCWLEVVAQQWTDKLMQLRFRCLRLFAQLLHQKVTAQVGGHQNDRITEVNFTPLAVAHKAPVKYLIKQIQHIPVGLFHFIQQHHTVRTLTYSFRQNTPLTVSHVPGR